MRRYEELWAAGRKREQPQPQAGPACWQAGGRFETEILMTRKNLNSLTDVPGKWIDRVHQPRALCATGWRVRIWSAVEVRLTSVSHVVERAANRTPAPP